MDKMMLALGIVLFIIALILGAVQLTIDRSDFSTSVIGDEEYCLIDARYGQV